MANFMGGGSGQEDEISLMSWLMEFHGLANATADILKDNVATINRRKIKPNRDILETEKKPEAVRISKNIVLEFQNAFNKAIKDLNSMSTAMGEELQKRYNLRNDWASTCSVIGSVAGSEVSETTPFRKSKTDIENMISVPGSSNRTSTHPSSPLLNENNDPCPLTFETTEKAASTGTQEQEEANVDVVMPSDEELEQQETIVNNIQESSSSLQIPTNKDDEVSGSQPSEPVLEGIEMTEIQIKQERLSLRLDFETPKKSPARSRDGSKTPSSSSKKNKKGAEQDPESDSTDSDNSGKTCVVPRQKLSVSKSPLIKVKQEAAQTMVLKNTQLDDADLNESNQSKKPFMLPLETENSDNNVKTSSAEAITNETGHEESGDVANTSKSTSAVNRKVEQAASNAEEADDFMDFLAPSSPCADEDQEMDFGVDDDTRTVIVPTSANKSKAVKQERLEKSKAERGASDPKHLPSVPVFNDSSEGQVNDKTANENSEPNYNKTDQVNKSNVKSVNKQTKEEIALMKDCLDSTSDSDTKSSSSKKGSLSRGRGQPKKKPEKGTSDAEKLSIMNDPKLREGTVYVKVTKLDAAIEKSLAEHGYVELENYQSLKKLSCLALEKENNSSSSDSDDSTDALRKLVKSLTKSSILCTKKYNKKIGIKDNRDVRNQRNKKSKPTRHDSCDSLDSDDTDSDTEFTQLLSKKPTQSATFDAKPIVTDSGSEDLSDISDSNNGKKTRSRTQGKSNHGASREKRRNYEPITISSDESGHDDMKSVLGSDSDSDNVRKRGRQRIKKEKSDNSLNVSKRRAKKGNSSDSEIVSIELSSDDSDFKDTSKKRRRDRDSSPEATKKKKKRRRIVEQNSSDNSDSDKNDSDIQEVDPDSDGENASTSQKGRKNIRKIMSSKALAKTTKEAEKDEDDRRKRLAEKQKLFNGVHKAPESDKIERVVLDVDPETKETIIEVDATIVAKLKPHQAEGIRFMYNACFESVSMIREGKVPGGCILAHCMGLGKTLQSIAFIHTILSNKICGINTALVICPLSTTENWNKECRKWTSDAEKMLKIHNLWEMKNDREKVDSLKRWQRFGGVGILHYDAFRRLADPKGKSKMKESLRSVIKETLLDPGPDIVICDEGHLLKNCKSILSLAVNNISTHRRVVLTGTPLQNNLVEYHTMMDFVKPNLLGSLQEFANRFANPIKNGQHADSSDHDVRRMKKMAHVLHRKLEGCVQRYDYSILSPYLPPKYEYILNIKLSDKQEQLYKHYLANVVEADDAAKRKGLLKYYAQLAKVWSHPIALTMRRSNKDDDEETEESEGSMKDFICDDESDVADSGEGSNDASAAKRKTRSAAANDPESDSNSNINGLDGFEGKWWNSIFKTKSEMYDTELSGKLIILQEILKTCEAIGDKVLIFSQFLSSLDIIEEFLQDWDEKEVKEQNEKDKDLTLALTGTKSDGNRWRKNIEYFRIDGQTKVMERHKNCENFNKKTVSRAKLFLISTKAGGLGINLYGANRVVIFDASWNPSQDMQSIFRVYRFGQDKPCYIYRLIAKGTMEEKILRRQITKLSLSSRVVDEQQIQRHFKFDDVNEMYRYDEESPTDTETVLAVPKDRLLADLLISHRDWVRGYEEFDSLLENKPDEGLSNEEKELAWAEYRLEMQKKGTGANRTSSSTEAQTYVKVKFKLEANYPGASEDQLEKATNLCFQVIEKIRTAMLTQNQLPNEQKLSLNPYIDPLKTWLAESVSDRPKPVAEGGGDILRPPPPEFYMSNIPIIQPNPIFNNNPYSYHQAGPIRPPILRRYNNPAQFNQQANAMYSQPQVQNIRNNFRNIISNTLPNVRQPIFNNPVGLIQQRLGSNLMNGNNPN